MPSQIAFTDRLIVSVGGNTEEIARESICIIDSKRAACRISSSVGVGSIAKENYRVIEYPRVY
jgi:hypothetical protein